MSCGVCNTGVSKYKCPNCRLRYCSPNCWKTHSAETCEKYAEESSTQESTLENYQYKTEDTVSVEALKTLDVFRFMLHLPEYSKGVMATLRNPHVRNILDVIDKSRNPVSALKVAMMEPIFVEFVEECLKVVEPMDGVE